MSKRIDWNDQRTFLAVLEGGSFSAAARELGVTQPAVRMRIDSLEETLGTRLFTRSVNGVQPNERALALAGPARTMARASESFVRSASADPLEVAGRVRVSVADIIGVAVMPRMIAEIRTALSAVTVEMVLSNSAADLLDREVDIAVRMVPPAQGSLIARRVGEIKLGLYAHRDYLQRCGMPETRADLAAHAGILPDRSAADLAFLDRVLPEMSGAAAALRTDSHPAQWTALKEGLGIGVTQVPLGEADPDLVRVLPEVDLGGLDVWIVTHPDLRDLPRVRATFDMLVKGFSAYCRG